MRSVARLSLLAVAFFIAVPTNSYAAETSTPSASTTPIAKVSKQILTQVQKDTIAAARLAFSAAKENAQNGFDRALADAKAIRDQAILAAGTDKNARAAAKRSYGESYRTIMNAYKVDLKTAKDSFRVALTAAYALRRNK